MFRSKLRALTALVIVASFASIVAAAPTPAPVAPTPAPASVVPATSPSPATVAAPAAPTGPTPPSSSMRSKMAAGDLLSAESILDVYREANGEDGNYLSGLGWLARGALLLGDYDKAARYASDVEARCERRIAGDTLLTKDQDTAIALGAAIEVKAQLLQRSKGAKAAVEYVRGELARRDMGVAMRSRLNKRINLMAMTGTAAPELVVDDWIGEKPSLAAMRGKPVVLFLWAEWCGDCRAQAAALARFRAKHAAENVQVIAVTRYFDADSLHAKEKARVDSTWKATYSKVGETPIVFSTASMERYGGSATPTFVFIDAAGIVRRYTPTRLVDAEFDRTLAAMVSAESRKKGSGTAR